jgi:hypothetical protein
VYLPVLAPRAAGGCEQALLAIGEMPSPEATKALLTLVEHKNVAFARKSLQTLNARLPDPRLEKKPPRDLFGFEVRRRWLVERGWRAEFAPAVRKIARKLLESEDAETLSSAAYIVQCLGEAEELPGLVKGLNQAAEEASGLGAFRESRSACQDLARAAQALAQRGVAVGEKPRNAGELIIFSVSVGAREKFRPKGWEDVLARALRHELPFVKEAALTNLPVPPPTAPGKLLPGLIEDRDPNVAIAACHVAEKWRAPELRQPVLRTLKTTHEDWLFNAAGNAATAMGARFEAIEILVARLDEEGMTSRCLSSLVDRVLEGLNGYGSQTNLDLETGRACKAAWQRFLARNGEALRAGKKFRLFDPAVPLAELFPRYSFCPPPGGEPR